MTEVVAVVAAHQEEATVRATVEALRSIPAISEVLVVADGCTDRTVEEALAGGARVLASTRRRGKGDALDGALDHAPSADVYVLVDGDVGATAAEAARLLDPVLGGRLDAAVGRLPAQAGGGFGTVRRLASALVRALTGTPLAAPLSGQRAVAGPALRACRPLARGFAVETGMTIDLLRLGFRVGEVEVAMRHRTTGRSPAGFLHRGRQGLAVLAAAAPRALRLR